MQVGGIGAGFLGFGVGLRFRAAAPVGPGAPDGPRLSVRDFAARVRGLGDALGELRRAGRHTDGGGRGRSASVASDRDLGLDLTPSAAVLRSAEPLRGASLPSSYSTTAPAWAGNSSADPTIGGTYNGAYGDTTLTFTATSGGVVGVAPVVIEVTDGGGQLVDTVSIGAGQGNDVFTLSSGLELSFTNGNVRAGDSFELTVQAGTGPDINPDGRFDETGAAGPNFEPGVAVTDGAFWVNGQRIVVSASDTLNDVLASISASEAGVTATFDTAAQRVVLTHDTPGSSGTITVGPDTSGFLDAVKMTGATLEPGARNDSERDIDEVAALAEISSGDFTINGVQFTVDTSQQSLGDLIRWINASEAGVFAQFEASDGRFHLRALGQRSLVLDDGASGLFEALGVEAGVYRGEAGGREVNFRDAGKLRRELADFARALGEVFDGAVGGYAVGAASVIRGAVTEALEGAFETFLDKEGAERLRSGLGLDLGERAGGGPGRELIVDQAMLGRALGRRGEDLADLLFSEEREDGRAGLLERLEAALDKAYGQLGAMLAPEQAIGLRLDVTA